MIIIRGFLAERNSMATSIQVNRQNVVELLKTGVEHPFIIPEYQRPYAWSIDEVKTLFDDLWEFTISTGGSFYIDTTQYHKMPTR